MRNWLSFVPLAILILGGSAAIITSARSQFGGGGSYGQCSGDMTGTYPSCTLAIVRRPTSTIAGLPACAGGTKGYMYIVTDALLPAALATVASGGAVNIGVTCNGTNWIVQ